MEFPIIREEGRNVTKCLFKRFLRTAELLQIEVKLIEPYDWGTDDRAAFTGAKLEMPGNGSQTKRIIALGRVDGLVIPVPEEKNT